MNSEPNGKSIEGQNNNRTNKLLITIIVVLLIIILLLLLLFSCHGGPTASGPDNPTIGTGSGLEEDPNAGEYVPETPTGASQGVAIPGWGSITIPSNQTEIVVDFYNPEANEGRYYLTFELRIPDDSEQGYEVLYTSGLVKPGLHIQKITLSRGLDAGTYDAVIHVQPYRMDEVQTPTNNADMKTELIVK